MARITARPTLRSPHPCRVCGCEDVLVDEAGAPEGALASAGALLLSECTRCEHRWTAARSAQVVRVQPRLQRVEANALNAA